MWFYAKKGRRPLNFATVALLGLWQLPIVVVTKEMQDRYFTYLTSPKVYA